MRRLLLIFASVLSASIVYAQGGHADAAPPLVEPPKNASQLNDALTKLVRRINAGTTTLAFDPEQGFLPALLRELHIPVSSQVLVFSKTSLQHRFISPQNPRALYFNDEVYVGFVPDAPLMELSAVDPTRGAIFYTLAQSRSSRPRLVTNEDCAQCHSTPATQGIPGHIIRSVFARPDGQIASGTRSFLTDHRSPLQERWGGWYVTGTLTGDTHMGNAVLREGQAEADFDRTRGTNIKSLVGRFHSDRYPSAESDIVALMVLEHQVRLHNMLARLHYDADNGLPTGPGVEDLLRYMLFVDEPALKGPAAGTAPFAAEFERLGPKDARGRSLRQFDLRTRLFRYPCSFLIYSDAFLALPAGVKAQIYGRLSDILSGRDTSAAFAKIQPADRTAVAEILTGTHKEFAAARH